MNLIIHSCQWQFLKFEYMHSLRATALTYALFYQEYELILIYTPEINLVRVKILDKASVFTRKSMNYFKNLFFIVDAKSTQCKQLFNLVCRSTVRCISNHLFSINEYYRYIMIRSMYIWKKLKKNLILYSFLC